MAGHRLPSGAVVQGQGGDTLRVLVAEDFEVLARSVARGLVREGMAVDVALDGTDALARLADVRYDVLVLDRDLPGTHGDDVCRQIAAERMDTRILMLTAASALDDRVEGLSLGADDYLGKPFDFVELVARVRALGRRSLPALPPTYRLGDLTLDPGRRYAVRGSRRLDLTAKDFAVLECLLASAGRVVSAEELLERAWDEAADPFTTAVKSAIRRLRTKLGPPPLIHTVRGGGYRVGEL
jgi:DNA-binding response OmpR family regulator